MKTLLYLGRTVAAIVCDVRSHWCACEMVYIAINTELKKKKKKEKKLCIYFYS